MSTCLESISLGEVIESAYANTIYNFSINGDMNKLFSLVLDTDQTFYIKPKIVSSSTTNPFVFISIIRKSDSSTIRNTRITGETIISADLQEGEYYICFRTLNGSYEISTSYEYISFSRDVEFICNVITGENGVADIKRKLPTFACTRPLRYTLVEGSLPSGLVMDTSGRIHGTLPLIDKENLKDFPSYSLYHGDGIFYTPIGVRYEFLVKLELLDNPEKFVFKKFCIMLVNDWDLTAPILEMSEMAYIEGEVEYDSSFKLPKNLCPPCETKGKKGDLKYVYDNNGFVVNIETIMETPEFKDSLYSWSVNNSGNIVSGDYTSKTNLVNNIDDMRYIINEFELDMETLEGDEFDFKEPTVLPESYRIHQNESLRIPSNVSIGDIREWINNNLNDIIEDGYSQDVIMAYVDKLDTVRVEIVFRDGDTYLDLSMNDDDENDIAMQYDTQRELILAKEPMYVKTDFFPTTLNAVISYESYN